MNILKITVPVLLTCVTALMAAGQNTGQSDSRVWKAEVLGAVGSGDFAPYHLSSLVEDSACVRCGE